jgi:hypothetical protein
MLLEMFNLTNGLCRCALIAQPLEGAELRTAAKKTNKKISIASSSLKLSLSLHGITIKH